MSEFDLTTLLNKIEALCQCGIGDLRQLASDIGERPQRVGEWITLRNHEPSGRVTMKLHEWAAKRTIMIATAGRQIQQRYRSAFARISKEHPGNGKTTK